MQGKRTKVSPVPLYPMTQSLQQLGALMRKEFVLEWRQRYALNGMLLYIVGAVFVCYLSFNARRGQVMTGWMTSLTVSSFLYSTNNRGVSAKV